MLLAIETWLRRAVVALVWLSASTLTVIMGITFVHVMGRNFFGRSVMGTVETISLMMGVLVFSGLAITEMNRRHIVVEPFQGLFPKPLKRASMTANSLIVAGVIWPLLDQLFVRTPDVWRERGFTMILKLPCWPGAILMLTGFALFCLILIGILFSGLLSLVGRPGLLGNWIVGPDFYRRARSSLSSASTSCWGFSGHDGDDHPQSSDLFPIVSNMGFDPIQFGVLVELDLITPPPGINISSFAAFLPDPGSGYARPDSCDLSRRARRTQGQHCQIIALCF